MSKTKMINPKTDDSGLRDFEADENEIGRRVVETEEGVTYTLKTTDPYGLVHIIPSRGVLPDMLKGQYTAPGEAQTAIESYLRMKGQK